MSTKNIFVLIYLLLFFFYFTHILKNYRIPIGTSSSWVSIPAVQSHEIVHNMAFLYKFTETITLNYETSKCYEFTILKHPHYLKIPSKNS